MFFRLGNTLPPLRNLSTLPPLASPHSSSEKFGTGSQHGGAGGWLGEVSRSIGVAKTPMAAEPEAAEVLMPKKWPLCLKSIPQKLSLCLLAWVEDGWRHHKKKKLAILTCLMDGLDAACVEENSLRKCGPRGILYNFGHESRLPSSQIANSNYYFLDG